MTFLKRVESILIFISGRLFCGSNAVFKLFWSAVLILSRVEAFFIALFVFWINVEGNGKKCPLMLFLQTRFLLLKINN